MNTSQEGITRRRRTRQEVRQLVSAFQTSGLRAREFCQQQGLAPSTLRRNLQRAARGSAPAQPPGVRFVAVNVNGAAAATAKPAPAAALEVVLAGGRRIAVGPGFDVATLGHLVRALEGL
jgi:transposase-like protein